MTDYSNLPYKTIRLSKGAFDKIDKDEKMTEDKGCKNCDALGIDSEIGVYYCCLSHRQDDLPKEFICDDYTPNKQLKRLEQENKELKKQIESQKGLITVGGKQQYKYLQEIDKLQQENKELKEFKKEVLKPVFLPNIEEEVTNTYRSALEEILESAKFAQCLPCGSGNLEDCINCNDDTTNNGQFCMEKRIHEIKTKCVEVLKYSEE